MEIIWHDYKPLLRVVVDTNIFVSGIISPTGPPGRILQALQQGDFTLISSPSINAEVFDVLRRPRLKKYHLEEALFDIGTILYLQAELVQEKTKVRASPDPDNDKFLAVAVDGKAQYIVTGDKSGLLILEDFKGIPIVTARAFLQRLQEWKAQQGEE